MAARGDSTIPFVTAERQVTWVEDRLNAAVNAPVIGEVLRAVVLFLCCVVLVPLSAPIYLVVRIAVILRKAAVNARRVSPAQRVVVITGCDTGFGFDAALEIARRGFIVVAGCLLPEGKAKLRNAWHHLKKPEDCGSLVPVLCDVTDEGHRRELLAETHGVIRAGKQHVLHAVINNAGIGSIGSLQQSTDEDWERVFNVNVFSVAAVTRQFVPLMKENVARSSGADAVAPRVVNVASQASFAHCMPGCGIYPASKAAVQGLTQCLHLELAKFGIVACSINPSFHRTKIFQNTLDELANTEALPASKRDRLEAAKGAVCLASRCLWDPKYVVDALVRSVEHRKVEAINPVGMDGSLVHQNLAAVPFNVFALMWVNVINPIGLHIAEKCWPSGGVSFTKKLK
uniref:Ketoreductase (KR) domain-containing protein n=1 Tax=Phaeomonas parva TaxID=124430 RepID=A0A6U4J788_9STRA|mmetsp:Transcript_40096/g.125535  ORF Transcript_40096/g.125535 Transcript_40096/m.125535 type:complete len:400 (+) Transcript_40096:49-1248(+)|eukprot:CAMPEP_0118861894 /NCGR_PEP_ID=MMETSP1163-20130328/7272_1 /TAXON_ID=124430 /ORGANISM="Phaeomonas parva, Strain CCMP2877" /LENGTH=399 /DNA_ID=CAMNT_0006795741 /DNA_START=28 /DNA_END=1227 /DNA_ORIENTATION=-